MLVLGGVAALNVAERRVRVDDAKVAQILQSHQVLALAQAVQPAAAERQGAKVLIDDVQQMFSPGKSAAQSQRGSGGYVSERARSRWEAWEQKTHNTVPYRYVSNVEVLHVMRALHVVVHRTSSCAAERFDGVDVAFLRNNTHT